MGNFAHPWLLWGTALFLVPLIIHLLNRRRYQRVPWAAMNFLLMAHRTNRKRVRMENLLLLIARCLAVILLAIVVARPFLSSDAPLPLNTEKRKDLVIVLDASYSMGLRDSLDTPFQRGVQEAMQILDRTKSERGDRATLILAKRKPVVLSWKIVSSARDQLRTLEEPSYEGANFESTMDWVKRAVDDFEEGGEVSICWISDLQKNSFLKEEKDPKDKNKANDSGLDSIFASLADRNVKLQVFDVGASSMRPANLGIVELTHNELEPNFAGAQMLIQARLRNYSNADRNSVRVRFSIDGNLLNSETVDIPASQEREVSITATVQEPGSHAVSASIDGDSLSADDERQHTFWVRPTAKILLVDSSAPNGDFDLLDTGMLLRIFTPEEGQVANDNKPYFLPTRVDRSSYFANPEMIFNYDLVVLANIDGFPEGGVERLENFVSSGKALLIALGDKIDSSYYNTKLRKEKKEESLLPLNLLSHQAVASRRTEYFRVAYPDLSHPALQFFRDEKWKPYLTEVPVYEFFRTAADPTDTSVKIIASLDDTDRSPLLVEKTLGRGRVALLTTSLNSNWNKLSESPKSFYPLMLDLFLYLTAGEIKERDLAIGDGIRLETNHFPRKSSWVDPRGSRKVFDSAPRNLGPDRYSLPEITETQKPGVYTVEIETTLGTSGVQNQSTRFAVNVEPKEGDLEKITRDAVPGYFPGIAMQQGNAAAPELTDRRSKEKGELWYSVCIAVISILVLESLMAAWFGRRRTGKQ